MELNKEEQLVIKRLKELARTAYLKNFDCYSDFLNLNEINLFYKIQHELSDVNTELYGGYESAERKIVCFYQEKERIEYPIEVLKISPVNTKFSENLSHRDYLGTILGLGIERSKVGDIVTSGPDAFVFCSSKISHFIVEQLNRVRHTTVTCSMSNLDDFDYKPDMKELSGTVSSLRLDAVLSIAFPMSRTKLVQYITAGKVFINGKLILSNSYAMKENDIVSVRGLGKFIYCSMGSQSKKGRTYVTIKKYI